MGKVEKGRYEGGESAVYSSDAMERIFDTIRKYHMIEEGMHIVAGVSGGADSVCLLLALCRYRRDVRFDLRVVHVEHGIRGRQSMEDAAFVEQLCKRLEVPLRVVHTDVPGLAKERKTSLEETARAERYRIFSEACDLAGGARIAVAHNRGDQAETVLWNLVRGSALAGLGGMRPVREPVIRPLLFTDRQEIEDIVREAGLEWRTDSTNLETQYTRNRIRLSILPQIEQELNVRASEHIASAAQHLQQVQEYLDGQTKKAQERCMVTQDGAVSLLLEPFWAEEELIRTELVRTAVGQCAGSLRDLGRVHIEDILRLCKKGCGKQLDLPGGVRAVRKEGAVQFVKKDDRSSALPHEIPREYPLAVPGQTPAGRWIVRAWLLSNCDDIMDQAVQEKKYTKWFSYDIIKNSVMLRTRLPGDYLVVNASGGQKKLKDYFIDRKIPKEDRDHVLLLADGPHILWVVGQRISEAAKVRPATEKVLKIQLEERGV